jgi:glycosyltransferase involved in cell wall biosynthesis
MKNNKIKIALLMQETQGWLGGIEYIKNLVLALGSLPEDTRSKFEIHLISKEPLDASLKKCLEQPVERFYSIDSDLQPWTLMNRTRWFLEKRLLKKTDPRLDVLIKQQNFDFIYPRVIRKAESAVYPSAAWIPDFQHKHLPQFFTTEEIYWRDRLHSLIAQESEIVVLSSKNAEADFNRFFPGASDKVRVLSFKTSPEPSWYYGEPEQIQKKYFLPDRFFLISNQFWQHKNHLMVFEALRLLQDQGEKPIIVCTGHIYDYRSPDYSDVILRSIHQLGIAQQVYLLGLIPKPDQIQLMRRSLAVIQPSLFEGWSTLVEDARSLGKTMLLSDIDVSLEQNPPNSFFFGRNSPESLASLIEKLWRGQEPGPNYQAESQSRESNESEVQAYGYRFLEIVQECCSSKELETIQALKSTLLPIR